jgi:glycosyltransferase involved in cell wall biosynthesis
MASGSLWKGTALLPELIRHTEDLALQWNLFGTTSAETSPILAQIENRPNVRLHGQVTLDEALAHIDVLLHLSLTLDPFPTVLLEAARAALPVIATRTGGSPEIVENAVTGLLIPPNDVAAAEQAIRHFYDEPEIRVAMGKAARTRFQSQFRVARMVADYFSFWNGLRSSRS